MADQEVGIKETKEAVVALLQLGKFVADRLKDGAGWDDAVALGAKLMDQSFRDMLTAAVDGIDQVPAELKAITLSEGVELIEAIIEGLSDQTAQPSPAPQAA